MASSDERRPNYSRRFFWFALFIVAAIGAYTAVWFYAADRLVTRVNATISAINQNGRRASCENAEVRGYPFRIGIFCRSVMYEDASGGIGFRARQFRSAAQVYSPLRIIGELDGPASVEAPGLNALELDWSAMRASIRFASPLPQRLSVEGKDITARLDGADAAATRLGTADTGEFHLRPNGDDLDVAMRFSGLKLDPRILDGNPPPLSGLVDVAIADGVLLPNASRGLRGRSGTIRTVTLSTDEETGATISGPISVDESGLIDAQLEVTIRNPEGMASVLGDFFPGARDEIRLGFSGISAMGETPTLPLRIEKGNVRLGFLSLGTLPPL